MCAVRPCPHGLTCWVRFHFSTNGRSLRPWDSELRDGKTVANHRVTSWLTDVDEKMKRSASQCMTSQCKNTTHAAWSQNVLYNKLANNCLSGRMSTKLHQYRCDFCSYCTKVNCSKDRPQQARLYSSDIPKGVFSRTRFQKGLGCHWDARCPGNPLAPQEVLHFYWGRKSWKFSQEMAFLTWSVLSYKNCCQHLWIQRSPY